MGWRERTLFKKKDSQRFPTYTCAAFGGKKNIGGDKMEKIQHCPADVKNRLYEAGIFKEKEDAVLLVGDCVLLEREKGERISYRVININNLSTKHLFTRKQPVDRKQYEEIADRIKEMEISRMENVREELSGSQRAEKLLAFLFDTILPKHGMSLREKQKELSMEMLSALQRNKLALCEAEVGTGKTHAYILALTIHNLFSEKKAPAVISTSTIALQKALTEEYIPQISAILLEHHIIDHPLSFAVRKGKSHYVCDSRLKTYEESVRHMQRERDAGLLEELKKLQGQEEYKLDLDNAPLTPHIKEKINVCRCRDNCPYVMFCRFMNFCKKCLSGTYDFQITNHNYILAEIIGQRQGHRALFPDYGVIVFDESHKLVDAARQMYSTEWEETEMEQILRLVNVQKNYSLTNGKRAEKLVLLCSQLESWNRRMFGQMAGGLSDSHVRESSRKDIKIGAMENLHLKHIVNGLEQLPLLCRENGQAEQRERFIRRRCRQLTDKLTVFRNSKHFICWIEKRDNGNLAMCAVPMELERMLFLDIWSRRIPVVITSGTMSVRGDFTHFKKRTGLQYAHPARVMETSKPSPFDYRRNGLLYIPERMPFPNIRNEHYIQAVMEEIGRIVRATHGHTLILFTSYWLMERIYYGLKEELSDYPLFLMGRGRLDIIRNFRKSGNGVLFASDSAGEGIDLAGDILSCLIVVKLPFPIPDPVTEYQRAQYEAACGGADNGFDLYRKEVIIPEMLIKLRQWFGRGIRRENDTTVFSILDSRASLRGRYWEEILNTLPPMPVTNRISDVSDFIIKNKAESYFVGEEMEE